MMAGRPKGCHRPARRPSLMRLALATALVAAPLAAQDATAVYVRDPDPLVQQKLARWQDLKLGLLMHWGTYSQWGIVESWSLCSEDEGWCRSPQRDSIGDYAAYKRAYEALQTTFNPVRFDPERWARAAKDAGMRYVVFTTKHHDGFSMFDTRQTDYRVTSPRTPFSSDPRADVTRAIFDAFRAEGFMIGAYFSKPDWHSTDYWWPYFATPDRNPNYDIRKYPDRWARFVAFTHAQINELMSNYGRVDILWLDGGWVRTLTDSEIHAEVNRPDYKFMHVQSQDIDMPRLVAEARAKQRGLIVVDRAVPGPYQDYLTPEARVPKEALPYPWEVPMPMASSWSFVPHDQYKPARVLIQMLVDVVAKGGNLLLNIGPGPDGAWDDAAYDRLQALGTWMKVNSESIYSTRPLAPFVEGKFRFTQARNGATYAIYLPSEGESVLPRTLTVNSFAPARGATITLVGTGRTLSWQSSGTGFVVRVPDGIVAPNPYAWAFRVSKAAP
jgi:alpha-L-fucosidase